MTVKKKNSSLQILTLTSNVMKACNTILCSILTQILERKGLSKMVHGISQVTIFVKSSQSHRKDDAI